MAMKTDRVWSLWCALLMLLAVLPFAASAEESWVEPVSGIEFVSLPKGCFKMGVPPKSYVDHDASLFLERIKTSEMPMHEVCVDAFWIGRNEVVNAEWRKVMGAETMPGASDAPVANVTWQAANEFIERLNNLAGDGVRFRLPTEAEWEYACKAGEKPRDRLTDPMMLNQMAWYSSSYDFDNTGMRYLQPQPVARKKPNGFGLYDMLGNVWEWTQDGYRADAYARHALYNPVEKRERNRHVIRGGSVRSDIRVTRCDARAWMDSGEHLDTVGLRLVRER